MSVADAKRALIRDRRIGIHASPTTSPLSFRRSPSKPFSSGVAPRFDYVDVALGHVTPEPRGAAEPATPGERADPGQPAIGATLAAPGAPELEGPELLSTAYSEHPRTVLKSYKAHIQLIGRNMNCDDSSYGSTLATSMLLRATVGCRHRKRVARGCANRGAVAV